MAQEAAAGRLLRYTDGRWEPVGDPLPPFDHAPPRPGAAMAPWILPAELDPQAGDIIVCGEVAHRLLARMENDDAAMHDLWEQTVIVHGVATTRAWFAEIQMWLGMRLAPGATWAPPPPSS